MLEQKFWVGWKDDGRLYLASLSGGNGRGNYIAENTDPRSPERIAFEDEQERKAKEAACRT